MHACEERAVTTKAVSPTHRAEPHRAEPYSRDRRDTDRRDTDRRVTDRRVIDSRSSSRPSSIVSSRGSERVDTALKEACIGAEDEEDRSDYDRIEKISDDQHAKKRRDGGRKPHTIRGERSWGRADGRPAIQLVKSASFEETSRNRHESSGTEHWDGVVRLPGFNMPGMQSYRSIQ